MRAMLREIAGNARGTVQIRYHERRRRAVVTENGTIRELASGRLAGVSVRVLDEGVWGFSCTSDLSRDAVAKALREAAAAARAARGLRPPFGEPAASPMTGDFAVRASRPMDSVPLEEKIALVRTTDETIRRASPKIVSAQAMLGETSDEKIIATSAGADVRYLDAKVEFRAVAVAADGAVMESGAVSIGATGGWDELFRRHAPEAIPGEAVGKVLTKLGAELPAAGMRTVVLHPELVGILAHEAIGHTVEADFVLSGSVATGRIGTKVAAETVTLVDDHLPASDPAAAGVLLVDDEGNRPEKAVLIENGILKGYLHDGETARMFGVAPTGNARAFTYRDEPLIRMRNTYIMPGTVPPEEIIAATPDGLYLKSFGMGGQADANAEFMFGVGEAWKIEKGKLTAPVKGVTISGQAFEVLSSVDMLGDDLVLDTGAGYCGKHQRAKVDGGGPHLRCVVKIGGTL